jgi:hypothetical protein
MQNCLDKLKSLSALRNKRQNLHNIIRDHTLPTPKSVQGGHHLLVYHFDAGFPAIFLGSSSWSLGCQNFIHNGFIQSR